MQDGSVRWLRGFEECFSGSILWAGGQNYSFHSAQIKQRNPTVTNKNIPDKHSHAVFDHLKG